MYNLHQAIDSDTGDKVDKRIFIKYSPLLDPIRYLTGKYPTDEVISLPSITSAKDTIIQRKLSDTNNASYVDNFFCYLSSRLYHDYNFQHGIDYYGTYLGIQKQYMMNIKDDYDFVKSSTFFNDNNRRHFHVVSDIGIDSPSGSRSNKKKLILSDDVEITTDDIDLLPDNESLVYISKAGGSINDTSELIYEGNNISREEMDGDGGGVYSSDDEESRSDSSSSSSSSSSRENDDEDEEGMSTSTSSCSLKKERDEGERDEGERDERSRSTSSSEYDEEESIEDAIYSYIYNFPVQMICLEKCDGTLDRLFEKEEIDDENSASILFQIVMILLMYQHVFQFTHNDLHTNNIMYIETDIPYLFYKYKNETYKVPTYGKIFKLIDFGRAIYRFQNKIFCSDSFAKGGDAVTQYNCEPYMNERKPRIDPNYSFDLCRLGTSIYDFIIDDERYLTTELQKTVHRWCLDDSGKNVLYKKNGEERYPNFKLYKMIARNVHSHTPEQQLKFPFFRQFLMKNKERTQFPKNGMIIP
jgi:hypothetical protein